MVELADWRAVEVAAGETVVVTFEIRAAMFGYVDAEMRWRIDPGEVDVIVGPHAAYENRAGLVLTD